MRGADVEVHCCCIFVLLEKIDYHSLYVGFDDC